MNSIPDYVLFLGIIFGIILFLMFCTVVYLLGKICGQAKKHSQFLAQIRDRLPKPEEEQEATEGNETRYGTKPPKKKIKTDPYAYLDKI